MAKRLLLMGFGILCVVTPCRMAMARGGAEDNLAPITHLLGRWEGEGKSFGKTSTIVHSCERILQDRFVHTRTRCSCVCKRANSYDCNNTVGEQRLRRSRPLT